MVLGAQGVVLGTRLLATPECCWPDSQKQVLVNAGSQVGALQRAGSITAALLPIEQSNISWIQTICIMLLLRAGIYLRIGGLQLRALAPHALDSCDGMLLLNTLSACRPSSGQQPPAQQCLMIWMLQRCSSNFRGDGLRAV